MTPPNTTPSKLASAVKMLRQQAGLSIRGLADAAGVDFSWLARLERGTYTTPDPRHLRAIAEALEVEVVELFLAAGYEDSESLPQFARYLRTKYDLPEEAIDQLDAHFRLINERYGKDGRAA